MIAADPARVAAAGGNSSMIHVDWMIGRAEMDIDEYALELGAGMMAWGALRELEG